jgi:putative hydrolase of the HAD superfamily
MSAASLKPAASVRRVFFDVGGTLLRVQDGIGAVYAAAAREQGVEVSTKELELRFRVAWSASLARSATRSFECSDAILRDEWRHIVADTFGSDLPPSLLPKVFEGLYERFVSPGAWNIVPGVEDTLERLARRRIPLGILSNWDSRLPKTLAELGLLDRFDLQVISYAVGYEKPHERIFREALSRAGEPASRALHVGDSWEADIVPARTIGMRALWVRTDTPSAVESVLAGGGEEPRTLAELTDSDWDALLGPPAER